MTNIYKLASVLLVLFTSIFFFSCHNNITEPVKGKTGVQFTFQKGSHNFYGKGWWKTNSLGETKKSISFDTKDLLVKPNVEFDEVKILVIDMTQWYDIDEFMEAWESSEQYALFDTSLWSYDRDDWDNMVLTLKSYTGDFYQFVGELNLAIEDSVARGTINLNPGLNYFLYCFRENGNTIHMNETVADIIEGEENVVKIGSPTIDSGPEVPSSPNPADGATDVSVSTMLNWVCSDPDGDTLSYYIYLSSSPDPAYYGFSYENSFETYNLSPNTTYYWKIFAYDSDYNSAESPVWSFTTGTTQLPTYGLVAHYPFNGNANDISGFGNDGTVYGPTLTTDRFGVSSRAYNFDGNFNYIEVPYSSSLSFTTNLTIVAWIKTSGSTGGICHQHNGSFDGNFVFGLQGEGNFRFGNSSNPFDSWSVNDNLWHCVAGIYDDSNNKVYHYIDGALALTQDEFSSLPNNSISMIIGDENYFAFPFTGIIDDIRIYNRALTGDEILALYNEGGK